MHQYGAKRGAVLSGQAVALHKKFPENPALGHAWIKKVSSPTCLEQITTATSSIASTVRMRGSSFPE